MYEEDHSWSFAAGLFVGALVGAALASLFSPRSGQQNREVVMERGLVLRDRVSEVASSAGQRVTGVSSTVTDRVSTTASNLAERASSTASTVAERASSTASTVTERASSTASTVAERASSVASTVADRASTAASTVQEVASTAATRVSEVASSATEQARGLASTAVETVRSATGGATEQAQDLAASGGEEVDTGVQQVATVASPEQFAIEQPETSGPPVSGPAQNVADQVSQPAAPTAPPAPEAATVPVLPPGTEASAAFTGETVRYDATPEIIITDTSAPGQMNEAARQLESDEQFEVDGTTHTRPYSTNVESGSGAEGDVPGAGGGVKES